jgi:hypothetical protein
MAGDGGSAGTAGEGYRETQQAIADATSRLLARAEAAGVDCRSPSETVLADIHRAIRQMTVHATVHPGMAPELRAAAEREHLLIDVYESETVQPGRAFVWTERALFGEFPRPPEQL